MASGQHGGTDHSGQGVKLEDTFTLLESSDMSVVEGIRHLILEQLSSGKEPWLVQSLVDYYYNTRSLRAQEILAEIREPLDKVLIEKIQEGLRSTDTRLQAMQLLLHIVDRQPPWTHCIVDRSLFPALLKCLKTEVDVPILMTGVMVVVILLPVVPVTIEGHLQDVFDIFARITALITRKPANCPDIFILHLHIGVYVLFLRLYGMFPCTFLSFLRVHYAKKENLMVYHDIITPMLDKVRFHPNLVSGSKDGETSKHRWRKVEPQDIVVNCAKMSLDPIEGTTEDLHCPIIPRSQPEIATTMKPPSKQHRSQDNSWQEKMEAMSELFPVIIDPASYGFSPSQLLGLATPPTSQRATPAASLNDLTASFQQSTGGTVSASPQIVTPTPEALPREMPVLGDETERGQGQNSKMTPVPMRSGPKTTPVGLLNRTQGSSAFTSPLVWRPPSTSLPPSTGPSPMKHNLSSDSLNAQQVDSAAARSLLFDRIPEGQAEGIPKHIEMRVDKENSHAGVGAAGPVPVESLSHIVRNLHSAPDSDPLDQEVSRITEVVENLESFSSSAASDHATCPNGAKHHKTAQSVIQFMKKVNHIRFNCLTSQNSEPLLLAPEKHARPGRARSCPPLRRRSLPPAAPETPFLTPPKSGNTGTTAAAGGSLASSNDMDTVSESAVAIHARNDVAGGGETSFLSSQLSHDLSVSYAGSKDGSEASSSAQTRTCTCQCGGDGGGGGAGGAGGRDGVEHALRNVEQLASMFQCLLAPVKVAVCRHCQRTMVRAESADQGDGQPSSATKTDVSDSWVRWPVLERAHYSQLSPPELLDRHLAQGSELHAKELANIPLTSKDNVSWTHFGGGPPVDEVNILRGEILLLQNQVMYERHKRSNHAMRNRRLLRRVAHVSAAEEQVQALTQQLEEQGKHVQNLQVSLKLLQDHNHQLQQRQDSDEYERLVDFKTTIQQNKDLQETNVELKNLLLTQKAENDELKKELQQVRAKSFELEKYNDMLQSDMASMHKWKSQVIQLQKEMLLMGEAQHRLQNHLQQQQRLGVEGSAISSDLVIRALKEENKELKRERTRISLALEACQCRLVDLEEFSKSKDVATGEMKNNFEVAKATYAEELKAAEDKYRSMIHINQQLDAQVLKLQAENDVLQQKLVSSQIRVSRQQRHSASPGEEEEEATAAVIVAADSPSQAPGPSPEQTPRQSPSLPPSSHAPSPPPKAKEEDSQASLRKVSVEGEGQGHGEVTRRQMNVEHSVSGVSKDSGWDGSTSVSGHLSPDEATTTTTNRAGSDPDPKPKVISPAGSQAAEVKARRAAGVAAEQLQGDSSSQLSDGPQGLAASRAMMYTDSEDNGSLSSNSIQTTDSGVFSKVEHAN